MIADIVKQISKTHKYSITKEYWGRIGMMCKRYGDDIVKQAVQNVPPQQISLTNLLNIVENKCQYIVQNGKPDEFMDELLNL